MLYIFSQLYINGKSKNDKDHLLFLDTLEKNNIDHTFLSHDISDLHLEKNDFLYLDIGADDLSRILNKLNQLDQSKIYPNLETIEALYLKDSFSKFCEQNNLKTPKTYYNLEDISEEDYPLIFKPVTGSLSEHLKICTKRSDVLQQIEILNKDSNYFNKKYILQEFINTGENPTKFRIIYIGNEVVASYKAVSIENKDFCSLLDNGKIHSVNITNKDVLNLAEMFFSKLEPNVDFGALDIIQSIEGECYLLELNAPTKLYRSSQAMSKNLYQNILDFLLTKQQKDI